MNLLELGKKPISEAEPAGQDAKFDPAFEELQAEIDKMSSATAGGGIKWDRVRDLSAKILAEKSKNIQVACYLTAALIKTQGLDGLVTGQTVLIDLINNFWPTLFPPLKRLRGRLNALTWLLDNTESYLQNIDTPPVPAAMISALIDGFKNLDGVLSAKTEDAPMFSKLVNNINRLPVQAEAAASPAPVAAAPEARTTEAPRVVPTAPTVQPAPAPAAIGDLKTADDAAKFIDQGLSLLLQASDFLMKTDLSNPLAYRLTRLAAWLNLDRLPMADGRTTPLPPPDSIIKTSIDNLMAARDYERAVSAAEARVSEYLFWLDLSRLTAQALTQLGGKYSAAAEMVATETALYLRRLPGLEQLTFSDGTPFADQETKAWLKTIALSTGAETSRPAGSGGPSEKIATALSQAQGLLKDSKPLEAIQVMDDGLQAGGGGLARLHWRLALVDFLAAIRPQLVGPQLAAILKEIDEFQIESLDPALAALALRTVYQGLVDRDDDAAKDLSKKVWDRLALVSAAEAFRVI